MARKKETLNQAFGRVIRVLRDKVDISQEEFAHRCGRHRTYISLVERGLRSPSLKSISAMAEALGVRPYQLVKMTEDRLR